MTISTPHPSPVPSPVLTHSIEAHEFVDAHFMARAAAEGHTHLRWLHWPTEAADLADVGEVVALSRQPSDGSVSTVSRLPTALASLSRQPTGFSACLAAGSDAELDAAEAFLREAVPERAPRPGRQDVAVSFWRGDPHQGAFQVRRRMAVPRWEEIEGNYTASTRRGLSEMVESFTPGAGGRLILWTGPPGTGKTWALRALAWEWREWCSVNYITDPEALFGSSPAYLLSLLTLPVAKGRWRLLVLEDSDELLAADAKSRTGQGLSRLLNITDGLVGQGFPTLVLVTTNEPVRTFHPAITRPGRCTTRIEFGALTAEESREWLAARDVDLPSAAGRTVAELYAELAGAAPAGHGPRTVGFAR